MLANRRASKGGCGLLVRGVRRRKNDGRKSGTVRNFDNRLRKALSTYGRLASVFLVWSAYGCPVCHTQTGDQVRSGILNSGFAWKLLVTALPFPVFAATVAWVYFSKPKHGSNNK
jgi:hypothetical protein